MNDIEFDTLITLFQQRGLAAWRRPLGGSDCVMIGADPLEPGAIRGWRRAAHVWRHESGGWWVTVASLYAGTFPTCESVADYIFQVLSASPDAYEREITRISGLQKDIA